MMSSCKRELPTHGYVRHARCSGRSRPGGGVRPNQAGPRLTPAPESHDRAGSRCDLPRYTLGQSSADDDGRRTHLLLIAGEFPPVGGGGVIRMVKLVKYLAPLGWQATVLCSDEPPLEHTDDTLLEELPDDLRVFRVAHPMGRYARGLTSAAKIRMDRRSRMFRLLRGIRSVIRFPVAIPDRWAPWALVLAFRPPKTLGRPDIILSSGPPNSAHLLGARLARRANVPFVMDLRDEWTLRPSHLAGPRWRRWIERRLESQSVASASRVVVVSAASVERYGALYPDQRDKFIDIPNGYDPADLEGLAPPTSDPTGALRIGYAGSFQASVDVRPIFAALGAVVEESRRDGRFVRIELVGPLTVDQIDAARRAIPEAHLGIGGFVPHREAIELMHGWDVLMIVADDGQASLAGKTYECLALRKPILLIAPEGPATELIRSSRAGAIADPGDSAGIRQAARDAMAMAGSAFVGVPDEVLHRYDRRRQAERWSVLLKEAAVRTS